KPETRQSADASQSSATAAVHDCSREPNGSAVNGSKYSANCAVGCSSSARHARRSPAATSGRPCRRRPDHNSQLAIGQLGPRQYDREWKPAEPGTVDGTTGKASPGAPAKPGPSSRAT